jgi:hypothetical protein
MHGSQLRCRFDLLRLPEKLESRAAGPTMQKWLVQSLCGMFPTLWVGELGQLTGWQF